MSPADATWSAIQTGNDDEQLIQERFRGSRILIADDNPVNREILKSILECAGLMTDTAGDGAQAIAMARQVHYRVILMDMQMPNVDGLEATRKIREIPGHLNTPIIAMTANTSIEDQTNCFEAGMSDFMAKPFHPNRLFAHLLHWLSLGDQAQPSTASTDWRPAS
jgi:CheY-like chemotaxis protein